MEAEKVKIRFNRTSRRERYGGWGLLLKDGQVAEVDEWLSKKLLRAFPDNFHLVHLDIEFLGERVHEPIELVNITILNVCFRPEVLQKSLLSYLPQEAEFINLNNQGGKKWPSMTRALNYGIKKARNDIIICVHEDTRFDKTWFPDFFEQESKLKNWGALGAVGYDRDGTVHCGSSYNGPRKVDLLDGFCLILNRKNKLFFDAKTFTDWHRYELDFCLQCHQAGLRVYTITGAIHHDQDPERHKKSWRKGIVPDQKLLERKWGDKFPELLKAAF